MPLAKQKRLHPTQVKRHGMHHRHSNRYVKVYWPYLPLLLITVFGSLLVTFGGHYRGRGVLSYAAEMSTSSLLNATNVERTARNQPVLRLDGRLAAAAQAKADDMAVRNYWAHTTPDGQEPWVFVQHAGYQYLKAGENLAYGFATSQDTVNGWMNSPGHRANLLDGAFRDVGFGFANVANFQGHGPQTIVVAEYGDPLTVVSGGYHEPVPSSTEPLAISTSGNTLRERSTAISRLQNLTRGSLPNWSTFMLGLIGGSALTYLLIKHSLGLRRLILRGEALFLHHPYIDAALLALVFVSVFLTQTTGFIR